MRAVLAILVVAAMLNGCATPVPAPPTPDQLEFPAVKYSFTNPRLTVYSGMKVYIAQGMEIAECELVNDGYENSQAGAEKWASNRWLTQKRHNPRQRQLKARYGANYRRQTSQVC